jgi:hypothetical protein
VGVAVKRTKIYIRFEFLSTVFWNLASSNLLNMYRCLRGICCLHLQGGVKSLYVCYRLYVITSQKTVIVLKFCFLGGSQSLALQLYYLRNSLYMHGIVSLTPWPLYPRERGPDIHSIEVWMGLRPGLDVLEKTSLLHIPGFEPWIVLPIAHSLY